MYTDLATYCTDSVALLNEVPTDFLIKDENDVAIGVQYAAMIGTFKNGVNTVAFIRVNDEQLAMVKALKNLTILSEVAVGGDLIKAMTPANLKLYKSVFDPMPYDVTLEDGTVQTVTPSKYLGAFA